MSVPLLLTILAGAATFIGAILGVLGQKPSNRVLAFSLGFAAGIMLLISLMEMLPAALGTEGMSPVLGYGMFVFGLLGYFALDRMLPHAHPQDLMQKGAKPLPGNIKRTAVLLTLGISLHNFPEGVATYVTASNNLELGFGIALAVALHNIPEGLAVAGPVYAATGSKRKAVFWAGISGMAEILGGVLAWLILGSLISPVVMAAIMAAVAGIMVALSVDELMPLAKEIDPNKTPCFGVLSGLGLRGICLVLKQPAGFLKKTRRVNPAFFIQLAGFALMRLTIGHQIFDGDNGHVVLQGKVDALWRARHAAVVVGQFTEHAGWLEACQSHQIDGCFCVTTAGQNAARLRAQREDVARTVQIGRFCTVGNGGTNGRNTVGSRHASGHAVGCFDGYRKAGAEGAGVVFYHHWQIQLLTALFVKTQADDPTAVANGQRHLLNGHGFGGENHITFVFTIFIVKHHHTATFTKGGKSLFDTFDRGTKRGK